MTNLFERFNTEFVPKSLTLNMYYSIIILNAVVLIISLKLHFCCGQSAHVHVATVIWEHGILSATSLNN